MKAQVIVRLKDGVLDPQGEAVNRALIGLGYDTISSVRQGKLIELELDETDPVQAETKVKNMCEKLLANTVIENYVIDILK
ncbi:MAG: phosphoribosylformylglycinamidine synthase [Rhodobacteraceae bacterium]|nr:phosphoribosylformylglycinamidine synthase [Paracoccaceae bacterium]